MGHIAKLAGAGIGIIVGVVALVGGVLCLSALIIMLIWGAIAGELGGPTIGYPIALLVALALGIVSSAFSKS